MTALMLEFKSMTTMLALTKSSHADNSVFFPSYKTRLSDTSSTSSLTMHTHKHTQTHTQTHTTCLLQCLFLGCPYHSLICPPAHSSLSFLSPLLSSPLLLKVNLLSPSLAHTSQ